MVSLGSFGPHGEEIQQQQQGQKQNNTTFSEVIFFSLFAYKLILLR